MEIAQLLSLATCVHEAIWQRSDGKLFHSFLKKTQGSSIGVGRCHPGRIKRVFFPAQKNPDPATNISYMIHSFSCTAWKPFERSLLEKERPWQVTKKSFSIFQKLSCKLSPHICIFFQSRKKGMFPNTHEKVLGHQLKAKNQLFELRGIFWLGNSLNEFDKRS